MISDPDPALTEHDEGFVEVDGVPFYVIPDVDQMAPFLMTVVSESDHWCYVSSSGGLTAGRRDAATALFPYETDDRLHLAAGTTGPVTVLRVDTAHGPELWEPFGPVRTEGVRRGLAKSVLGDVVIFEEAHQRLGLVFGYRWSLSDRFGFIRASHLRNLGGHERRVQVADGLANLLPHGISPALYRARSNLTHAYKRSELLGHDPAMAVHTLEALIVDQATPAESLRATVSWSVGPAGAGVNVDAGTYEAVRAGEPVTPAPLVTGRPGAHVITATATLNPGETHSWLIGADVAHDHASLAALRRHLEQATDIATEVEGSVRRGSQALVARVGAADALQHTGDEMASAHHLANVLFNTMRGGTFPSGYQISARDFAAFVEGRNRAVAARNRGLLEALPVELGRANLLERVATAGDPQLERLASEYLPLAFSRRHGDPSRPWNEFSIRVRDEGGNPVLNYEGNWRDIFQNWEALCLSFPEYLPAVIAAFVNASTRDGFNPYRITREGIDWEVLDADDPWSNIGYWGDHQIVYVLRLLQAQDRFDPGGLGALLDRRRFAYADVPYRLAPYERLVADPRSTIRYDDAAAARSFARAEAVGGDGKLVWDQTGEVHLVTLLEKLLVAALSKLSNFVPGGGTWLNTQRPEWNDANNALAGYGLSMVTACHLRHYLRWLEATLAGRPPHGVELSQEVADWLAAVTGILAEHLDAGGAVDDGRRRAMMDGLGAAFSDYRDQVHSAGFSGTVEVAPAAVSELCRVALTHLDDTIRGSRRPDGLYHSYNLVGFGPGEASVDHLQEMLEGQVAVLSSGVLDSGECGEVIDALYGSALYRPDQDSFMLYPDRRPPPFVDKNLIPADLVAANPLFRRLLEAGDTSVIGIDVDGRYHFHPDLSNATELSKALDRLAEADRWRQLVDAHRAETLAAYEAVFRHHAFTGRSGTMYAYEGLGSIYWHMVAKLLVAVQECVVAAVRSGASPTEVERLRRDYQRIRAGLGFNKSAAEYGAFPTDPYSHTPADAGAQQPGMTGQVKEEIITRRGELGVWIEGGELCFDPILLRRREFLPEPQQWSYIDLCGRPQSVDLPQDSLGLTVCQVPVIVALTDGEGQVTVTRSDESIERLDGLRLGHDLSREIFRRSGALERIEARVPSSEVTLP